MKKSDLVISPHEEAKMFGLADLKDSSMFGLSPQARLLWLEQVGKRSKEYYDNLRGKSNACYILLKNIKEIKQQLNGTSLELTDDLQEYYEVLKGTKEAPKPEVKMTLVKKMLSKIKGWKTDNFSIYEGEIRKKYEDFPIAIYALNEGFVHKNEEGKLILPYNEIVMLEKEVKNIKDSHFRRSFSLTSVVFMEKEGFHNLLAVMDLIIPDKKTKMAIMVNVLNQAKDVNADVSFSELHNNADIYANFKDNVELLSSFVNMEKKKSMDSIATIRMRA